MTEPEAAAPPVSGDIAIIGMACLFPGAPDLDTYWENILSKVDAVTEPPPEMLRDHPSSVGVYCWRGGFLGALAQFDPLGHGVMPMTVQGGEPEQWLALQVARAALADAGYGDDIPERHRTAVILGKGNYLNHGNLTALQHFAVVAQTLEILQTLHPEYSNEDLELIRQELGRGLPPFSADTAPGLIPNITAARIANRLDLMGSAYTVDAACASSLVAVDIAIRELLTRECDLALVGGCHVAARLPMLAVFCQLGALSRRGRIRPFDREADGTILGEGVGMVVLKRREDAERSGQRIYALIKGVGVSSDGHGLSVMAPRPEGEVVALRRAYAKAGISPRTVGLIEAHGTGTPVGDAAEVEALATVFGPGDGAGPWCALGSVKSMIGHLMPAAGIAGLIKAALALYHRVLPPALHVDHPVPTLARDRTPFYLNTEARPWVHGARLPRRAGVNAFGFGGVNAHAILEESGATAPSGFASQQRRWDSEVCILSAASRSELTRRAQQLDHALAADPEVDLRDLAYTLNVPLANGPVRLAIVASTVADLRRKVQRALPRLNDPGCRSIRDAQGIYFADPPLASAAQLAFLFPGEGSQYPNMLRDLCIHFPVVREIFDLTDQVFRESGRGELPSDFIFPRSAWSGSAPPTEQPWLWRMDGAVEAVVTANRALFTFLTHLGIHPDAVVGHSSGEYSAMFASGMIRLAGDSELGEFATELNRIYREAAGAEGIERSVVAAVAADSGAVSLVIGEVDGGVAIAMDNCSHQTVIVGSEDAAGRALAKLRERGVICQRLPFDRPYHTPLFEPLARRLRAFFARWITAGPTIRAYSCTTMGPFPTDPAQCQRVAVEHWVRPVEFRKTIERMYADGVRIFVEVGPKGNLSAFVTDILRGQAHLAVPADVMHRPGITQLNHLVATLAAHGVPMRLDTLYAHRSPRKLDLGQVGSAVGPGRMSTGRVKVATGWPKMSISAEAAARIRRRPPRAPLVPLAPDAPHRSSGGPGGPPGGHPERSASPPAARAAATLPARPLPVGQVMSAHWRTMEQFLDVQRRLMEAFLERQGRGLETPRALARPSAPEPAKEGQPEVAPPPSEGAPLTRERIGDLLLQLVSERTGYPIERLDPDLNIEADLGIDSIKRVEILGALQRQTGLFQGGEMEKLAGAKTLQQVIDFLALRPGPEAPPPSGQVRAEPPAPAGQFAFIGSVVSLVPGEEVVARCELNADHVYLRHHTIGREVSAEDPELGGLPVLPLTMSMEMLAEAAALLTPGRCLVGMRDVHAHRWITLEEDRLTLELVARREARGGGHGIRAQIREVKPAGPAPLAAVEGTMVFADSYPAAPELAEGLAPETRPSKWAPEELYRKGMFHGPAFRGVVSMDRSDEEGAEATIEVLPATDLFRARRDPSFLTDPVLLDQAGQVVGLWAFEQVEVGLVFPVRVEALHLYGPPPPAGDRLTCRARIHRTGRRLIRSDLDLIQRGGRLWARLIGWNDWWFDAPPNFVPFLLSPRDVLLSEPWDVPLAWMTPGGAFRACRLSLGAFPEGFFTAHGGIWGQVLAHAVLGRRERKLWRTLGGSEVRRLEWLLGRVVVKDAVRQHLVEQHGLVVCPADIEIIPDEHGRPIVEGAWRDAVARPPVVSLSHSGGVAVALAGDGQTAAGVGVDIKHLARMPEVDDDLTLSAEERAVLASLGAPSQDGWPLRLWCAKEAAAKALGRSVALDPGLFRARKVHRGPGTVEIEVGGEIAQQLPSLHGRRLVAHTACEGDLVVATCAWARTESP